MLLDRAQTYTNALSAGQQWTITPSGGTTLVKIYLDGSAIIQESLTAQMVYGPYLRDVTLCASVISGTCTITESMPSLALHLEGWDDLRFPAQAINPAGANDAPSVDTTLTGFPGTLLFSGTQDNVICGIAQLPHDWRRGSAIRPHIHWAKPTGSSSAVSWVHYYRLCGFAGEAPGEWVGPVAGTLAYGDQTVSDQHLITTFGTIDLAGQKESCCLNWQIRRLGNTDADNNAVRLLEFDFHYYRGKGGTVTEIPS